MEALGRTLNLGIVAHVDAGKTSLTERILYEAGVLDAPGSVDTGDTQTDSMALERQRGITIRSAVVSFEWRRTTVNLIDTPGHSDFIAEVERALAVLDAAVLVVSAVEGVQAQTLVLMRALQRLGLPVVVFVNKVDRAGADPDRVLAEITSRLSPEAFALGRVVGAGTRDAAYLPFEVARTELRDLRARALSATGHPVLFGSAITGAGVGRCSTPSRRCCRDPATTPPGTRAPRSSRSSDPVANDSFSLGSGPGPPGPGPGRRRRSAGREDHRPAGLRQRAARAGRRPCRLGGSPP